jgi:hypothetical protein
MFQRRGDSLSEGAPFSNAPFTIVNTAPLTNNPPTDDFANDSFYSSTSSHSPTDTTDPSHLHRPTPPLSFPPSFQVPFPYSSPPSSTNPSNEDPEITTEGDFSTTRILPLSKSDVTDEKLQFITLKLTPSYDDERMVEVGEVVEMDTKEEVIREKEERGASSQLGFFASSEEATKIDPSTRSTSFTSNVSQSSLLRD